MDAWLNSQSAGLADKLRIVLKEIEQTKHSEPRADIDAKVQSWSAFLDEHKGTLFGVGVGAGAGLGFGIWEISKATSKQAATEMAKTGAQATLAIAGALLQFGIASWHVYSALCDRETLFAKLKQFRTELQMWKSKLALLKQEYDHFTNEFIHKLGAGYESDDDQVTGVQLACAKLVGMESRVRQIWAGLQEMSRQVHEMAASSSAKRAGSGTMAVTSGVGGLTAFIVGCCILCPVTLIAGGITLLAAELASLATIISHQNVQTLYAFDDKIKEVMEETAIVRDNILRLNIVAEEAAKTHTAERDRKRREADAELQRSRAAAASLMHNMLLLATKV